MQTHDITGKTPTSIQQLMAALGMGAETPVPMIPWTDEPRLWLGQHCRVTADFDAVGDDAEDDIGGRKTIEGEIAELSRVQSKRTGQAGIQLSLDMDGTGKGAQFVLAPDVRGIMLFEALGDDGEVIYTYRSPDSADSTEGGAQ